MRYATSFLIFLTACGPGSTTVEGTVDGVSLSDVGTVFWGGRYLVLIDAEMDCIELSFVNHSYSEGADFGDTSFAGLQFTFSRGTEVFPGNFSVEGAAEVNAKFLNYSDGIFDASDEIRGRSGTFVVDKVGDKEWAAGSFDISFGDSGEMSGTFAADWCVNLPD